MQSLEQNLEVMGQTCIDGGKCHHHCTQRCFRRACCEPFSDYSGPWKYPDAATKPEPCGERVHMVKELHLRMAWTPIPAAQKPESE